jgi:ribosomal protein S18 acetylase RimI-like enzyme
MRLAPYAAADQTGVIELWKRCDLTRPWNDPVKDIERKLTEQPELFLVGKLEGRIVATAMAGFDGHRGWVNYLAVDPSQQKKGLGRILMHHVEQALQERGCPKLNIQVRASNKEALEFYRKLGYTLDDIVSLGKRLIRDG